MKKVSFFVVPLLVLMLLGWVFYVQLSRGDFVLSSYSTIETENIEINKPILLGYQIDWSGNGQPIINDIRFIKKDGSYFNNTDEAGISINLYIQDTQADDKDTLRTLVVEESQKDTLLSTYKSIENYAVDDRTFNLVVEVNFKDEAYENEFNAIEIDYELLGSQKKKLFSFHGFVAD